jgi:hypothetical protein
MQTNMLSKIEQAMNTVSSRYYKMILVCEYQNGKFVKNASEKLDLPLLNISLLLSEKLKEYPKARMTGRVHSLMNDILRVSDSDVICLENIEILFDPVLNQDVIQLLQSFSRNYTLIVSWRGSYDGKRIVYAEPGHPEYYAYNEFDGVVII